MGATKQDEGFLPSKSLSVIEGLAKGFSMYGKELKEREIAKQGQMADAFKVIFPQYMMMMRQTQQQQFEAPYKRGALNLKMAGLQLKSDLGWADIATRMKDIEGEWEIAKLGATTQEGIAAADRALKANLEGVRAMITKFSETEATKRTAMGVAGRKAVSEAEIESREEIERKRAADTFENQMRIQADEYRLRGLELDREIAAGKYARTAVDPIIGQKFTNYRAAINMTGSYAEAMTAMAVKDPKAATALLPYFNQMKENLSVMEADLNRDLAPEGSIPSMRMPSFETEETGRWFWKGEKVVPKIPGTTPAPARGAAPSVSRVTEAASTMVKRGISKLNEAEKATLRAADLDPDAVEAEAKRMKNAR